MKNRRLLIVALVLAAVVVAGIVFVWLILPGFEQPRTAGTLPAITSQFGDLKTKPKTTAPTSTTSAMLDGAGVKLISFERPARQEARLQGFQFTPCTELRGATATPQSGEATQAVTEAPTAAATQVATQAATTAAAEPDFVVLRIVPEESEACYQVGEIFLNQGNSFNLAIGVTKAIAGEVAIDRANLANSKVGEIVIDISQFQSDERMRDGRIRREWLESNQYPLAKLTESKVVGLPARPYQDGEVLNFQIVGMLQVREVTRETTFNVTASLKGDTLTGTATTDFKMTEFGFDPPSIGGVLRANDDVHVVFNFVAREPGQ